MSADVSRYVRTLLIATAAMLAICVPSAFALPTGRAYEKVSPEDKGGNDIISGISKIAAGGDAANYSSSPPSPRVPAAASSASTTPSGPPPVG